jgi:hypothetical protein
MEGVEGRAEVAQTMYTHVNKYKNDKRKRRKKKKGKLLNTPLHNLHM